MRSTAENKCDTMRLSISCWQRLRAALGDATAKDRSRMQLVCGCWLLLCDCMFHGIVKASDADVEIRSLLKTAFTWVLHVFAVDVAVFMP